jgi:hypothetical protein
VTWTYDNTAINTDLAKVRLLSGLTDTNDRLLTDEEVNWQIGQTSSLTRAAAECLRLALRSPKVMRATDRNGPQFSASRSQRYQQMKDTLADLDAKAASNTTLSVDFGSTAAHDALESDSDFTDAAFKRGLFDNG